MSMAHSGERWAIILGASSGFGGTVSVKLAEAGFHIAGVHLDRKATLPSVEQVVSRVQQTGRQALFFNVNAADPENRKNVLDQLQQKLSSSSPQGKVMVLMHSLAFGTLKPYITDDPKDAVTKDQMEMTLDVMANSLVYWTQDLVWREVFGEGAHVFSMTSSGGTRVWHNYGAVSAAKAALESHTRQLALELAKYNIAVNCIRAGVTDTPALRKIPGHEQMIEFAKLRNPYHRLTTPDDVAALITSMSTSGNGWVTGNVIGVDGGEDVVG
jgi:NAD(P)-dependent dehydrogenase (short-subunit alcohol dehydrogenase family)